MIIKKNIKLRARVICICPSVRTFRSCVCIFSYCPRWIVFMLTVTTMTWRWP